MANSWEEIFNDYRNMSESELLDVACTECTWAMDYLTRITDYNKAKDYLFSFMITFSIADDGIPNYDEYLFIGKVWKRLFNEQFNYNTFSYHAWQASNKGLEQSTLALFREHYRRDVDFITAVSNLGLAIGAVDGDLSKTEKKLAVYIQNC